MCFKINYLFNICLNIINYDFYDKMLANIAAQNCKGLQIFINSYYIPGVKSPSDFTNNFPIFRLVCTFW